MRLLTGRLREAFASYGLAVFAALAFASAVTVHEAADAASLSLDDRKPAPSATTVRIDPIGLAVPVAGGSAGDASIVFPTSDAANGTTISVTGFAGGQSPLPAELSSGKELMAIRMVVSHATTFRSLPAVYYRISAAAASHPLLVELTDAHGEVLERIDQFPYSASAFVANVWPETRVPRALRLDADRTYYLRLIIDSPAMTQFTTGLASATLSLPRVNGLGVTVTTPPVAAGGGRLIWRVDKEPPLNIPPLDGDGSRVPIAYATMGVLGNVTYDGRATVTVDLPDATVAPGTTYGLAAFDTFDWMAGWKTSRAWTAKMPSQGSRLTFEIDVPNVRMPSRRFAFALYRLSDPNGTDRSASPLDAPGRTLGVTIGDSIPLLTVLPPSQRNCRVDFSPLPSCQLDLDPAITFSGMAARMTGIDMLNLSSPGAQTTVDFSNGDSILGLEIPLIPKTARIVIFAGGVNHLEYSPKAKLGERLDVIDAAIRARAPLARIVYVGLRYYNDDTLNGIRRPLVDVWDARERALAEKHGDAFVDVRTLVGPGRSDDSLDGAHYTLAANRKIAASVARSIRSLLVSGQ